MYLLPALGLFFNLNLKWVKFVKDSKNFGSYYSTYQLKVKEAGLDRFVMRSILCIPPSRFLFSKRLKSLSQLAAHLPVVLTVTLTGGLSRERTETNVGTNNANLHEQNKEPSYLLKHVPVRHTIEYEIMHLLEHISGRVLMHRS